jgi:hypothetical protein
MLETPNWTSQGVTLKIQTTLVMRMKSSKIRGLNKSKNNAEIPRTTNVTASKESRRVITQPTKCS